MIEKNLCPRKFAYSVCFGGAYEPRTHTFASADVLISALVFYVLVSCRPALLRPT